MEQQKTKPNQQQKETTKKNPKPKPNKKKEPPSPHLLKVSSPHLLKEFKIKNGLFYYCKCSLQASSVELGLPMAPLQQEMSAGLPHYHINTPVTCN